MRSAAAGDVGTPGHRIRRRRHKEILPELGLGGFRDLNARPGARNGDRAGHRVSMSGPSSYVSSHPNGSNIADAAFNIENPPKKYQDIYRSTSSDDGVLCGELKKRDRVLDRGGRCGYPGRPIPHQAFPFWNGHQRDPATPGGSSRRAHAPELMHRLANSDSRSPTLFHMAQQQAELTEYFTELAQDPERSIGLTSANAGHPAGTLQSGLRPCSGVSSRRRLWRPTTGLRPHFRAMEAPAGAGTRIRTPKSISWHWRLDRRTACAR